MVSKDIAVKNGNSYYHSECLKEKENKIQIRKIFYDRINQSEIMSVLNKVINNIIEDKKVSSEFLLYALCYTIRHKLPLNHAAGLYYIINNDEIKQAYKKYQDGKIAKINMSQVKTEKVINFKINQIETKGWDELLK